MILHLSCIILLLFLAPTDAFPSNLNIKGQLRTIHSRSSCHFGITFCPLREGNQPQLFFSLHAIKWGGGLFSGSNGEDGNDDDDGETVQDGKSSKRKRNGKKLEHASGASGRDTDSTAAVASLVASMGRSQKAQRYGQRTASLLQELAGTTVEGVAADGKIKIVLDGQQRPVSVKVDPSYYEELLQDVGATATDLGLSLTLALQDAHAKSLEKMEEKMKTLYADLGLPPEP